MRKRGVNVKSAVRKFVDIIQPKKASKVPSTNTVKILNRKKNAPISGGLLG